jgi:hypothetical protein
MLRLAPPSVSRVLMLGFAALLVGGLAACGGGGGYAAYEEVYYEEVVVVPLVGDVEVDNQTDLTGTLEDLYAFEMAPALTDLWTGNLLPDIAYPGETLYVGSFDEDFYDAYGDLDLGIVDFFDVFVEAGFTTTFEVY